MNANINKNIEIELKVYVFGEPMDKFNPCHHDFSIRVFNNGEQIGSLHCYHEEGYVFSFIVYIKPAYRRKKIATKMVDYAQNVCKKHIFPHHENKNCTDPGFISEDEKAFWNKRARI